MAKSGREPRANKPRKAKDGNGGGRPYKEDELIRALNHALRRQALRLMHASKAPLSPAQVEAKLVLDKEPKAQLSNVSYHMKVLAKFNVTSLVGEQQVRGAMEHFYASEVADNAWVRDLLKRTRKADEAQLRADGR